MKGGGLCSFVFILVGIVTCFVITPSRPSHGESCLMLYKQGGAPVVFQSSECPRWNLSLLLQKSNCQFSMLQGRRKYMEDRIFCQLNILVPFPAGKTEIKEVKVGMAVVFDGHRGAEASEMASKLLLQYFLLHASFLMDEKYSSILGNSARELSHTGELDAKQNLHGLDLERSKRIASETSDGSFHREILKESLVRAINDINATFSKEAFAKDLHSGTTASVVLLVDGQILVANVGDSKALLCSERFPSSREVKDTLLQLRRQRRLDGAKSTAEEHENFKKMVKSGGKRFFVSELTTDHHPDRYDERSRIEAAGGYVTEWNGVPRVNGELAVSRSIGDVSFKRYGVVSEPEVTDWQALTADDSYLLVASDGVFEKMSTQDVCDLTWELDTHKLKGDPNPAEFFFSLCNVDSSVADCIVNTAFEKGSMDNMAAIVVPLGSRGTSST